MHSTCTHVHMGKTKWRGIVHTVHVQERLSMYMYICIYSIIIILIEEV